MNLFNLPGGDQSVVFLGQIFGYVGSVLPSAGPTVILGTLFKVFNTIVLLLGTIVLVYTTVVGLLATAHEGEFMGKKWSGLWVPLRSLLGIAALFPSPSGYSAIQIIFMWIIVQGIGAADLLWTTALNYVSTTGSIMGSGQVTATLQMNFSNLFSALTCAQTAHLNDGITYIVPGTSSTTRNYYYCYNNNDGFCTNPVDLSLDPNSNEKDIGPQSGDICGKMFYCDIKTLCNNPQTTGDKLKCLGCQKQHEALTSILNQFGGVAQLVAQTDNQYINFMSGTYNPPQQGAMPTTPAWINNYCASKNISPANCCTGSFTMTFFPTFSFGVNPSQCTLKQFFVPPDDTDPLGPLNAGKRAVQEVYLPYQIQSVLNGANFANLAQGLYTSTIVTAVVTAQGEQQQQNLTGFLNQAQSTGWIYAGAFYYQLAQQNNGASEAINPLFTVAAKQPIPYIQFGYRTNFTAASQYLLNSNALAIQTALSQFGASLPSQMQSLNSSLNGAASGIMSSWMNSLTASSGSVTNPLSALQAEGAYILAWAEGLMATVVLLAVLVGAFQLSPLALGTGVLNAFSFLKTALFVIYPLLIAFIGALFTIGGLLAVYVPLIPYVVFAMAAIGWFIGVIEAMIAAPLVALGMLSPGGQHEILGQSERALMLLLGVFLRPSLMIFGLMAAMLLASVGVTMINLTFSAVVGSITSSPGLSVLIIFLVAYTYIIITVINKAFSLIHHVPERVMVWIGGEAVGYGEEAAVGEVKKGVESGAGATSGGVEALGGFAYAKGKASAKGTEKKREAEKKKT